MAKTTPMQQTLAMIKKDNLKYWKVETWNQWSRKRIDLFNIIDVLVLDSGIIGVQVTGTDFKSHQYKIMDDQKENTMAWLENGGRLEVHGWRRVKKKRGGKAMVWKCRIADVLIVKGELYWEERV